MGTVAVSAAAQAFANRTYAASQEKLSIRMSGYDYDRVNGLIDGSVEIEGYDHAFEVDTIGGLNTNALGGPMTREVTELGMVPYILAYANEDQQNHTLIPVFPLRVFRHKSVFILTPPASCTSSAFSWTCRSPLTPVTPPKSPAGRSHFPKSSCRATRRRCRR